MAYVKCEYHGYACWFSVCFVFVYIMFWAQVTPKCNKLRHFPCILFVGLFISFPPHISNFNVFLLFIRSIESQSRLSQTRTRQSAMMSTNAFWIVFHSHCTHKAFTISINALHRRHICQLLLIGTFVFSGSFSILFLPDSFKKHFSSNFCPYIYSNIEEEAHHSDP